MHDPLTVAFEIRYPWKDAPSHLFPKGYRHSFITIWHKDPCTDGSDSSCHHRYEYRRLNRYEKELAQFLYDAETIFDNRPHYPDSREHKWFQELKKIKWEWRKRRDIFRIPWRFHFWHWRFQIHPLQKIWRYLFARCSICKGRFEYNEDVIGNWSGTAIWHYKCDSSSKPK